MGKRNDDLIPSHPGRPFNGSKINKLLTTHHLEDGSITAGKADPVVNWGSKPLNGGFESQSDISLPPDHWVLGTGTTWGAGNANVSLLSGSDAHSGNKRIRIYNNNSAGTATKITSASFSIVAGQAYMASIWANDAGGAAASYLNGYVEWYDNTGAFISESTAVQAYLPDATSWTHYGMLVTAPATAKFAKIRLESALVGPDTSLSVDVDSVEMRPALSTPVADEYPTSPVTSINSAVAATLLSKTFSQRVPGSRIIAMYNAEAHTNTVGDYIEWELFYNGVSAGKRHHGFANTFVNETVAFAWELPGEATAGDYTLELKWRRSAGAGTEFINGNSSTSLIAWEVS